MIRKVYRIEHRSKKEGIWRDWDGNYKPIFDNLTDGKSKNLPMNDSSVYRIGGKKWFASAPTRTTLKHWFSKLDVLELLDMGYEVIEFKVKDSIQLSDYEVIFTRDNILGERVINYKEIW